MSGTTGRPGWAMCCSAGSIDRERVRRAPRRPVASPPVIGSQGALLGAEALRRLAEQCRVEIDPGLTGVELYGVDLVDYIYQEFGAGPSIDRTDESWQPRVTVAFWREFVE